jgi:hypothetical protein
MNLSDVKEAYQFEVTRKHQIESSISLLVGLLTALSGFLGSMIVKFETHNLGLTVVFSILGAASAVFLGISFSRTVKVYKGYSYQYLPKWNKLSQHEKDIRAYHAELGSEQGVAEKDFEEYLVREYVDIISNNTENNDAKVMHLFRARNNLVRSVLFLFLAGIPYTISIRTAPQKISRIEIVNDQIQVKESTMHSFEDKNDKPSEPIKPEPTRPEAPPRTILKESKEPPKDTKNEGGK